MCIYMIKFLTLKNVTVGTILAYQKKCAGSNLMW